MADEIYTFRTIRVVDDGTGTETNIIADQSEDVLTFESAGDISFQVVEDRIIMSTQNVRGYTGSIGYTGSKGYTGSVGIQGENGHTGSRGFLGSKGFSGSLGYTGSQGTQGNIGHTGSRGFTGSKGADSLTPGYTGSKGLQGIIGFSGSVGPQGNVGYTGSQGIQGNIGFTGSKGFIGFTGSGGSTGSQGLIGFTGSIGYTGSRGSGGFTGSRGYTGSRGSQGIQGVQGAKGYTGSRGLQGIKGNSGYSGSRGFAGSTGFTGSRGVPGPQGSTGAGFTGSQGVQGSQGVVGPEAEAFKVFRTLDSNGVTRNIVADQSGDILTWVSGDGIYLDFNEGTDTITVLNTELQKFSDLSNATGTVIHDCNNGHIFYHTSPVTDFTANFTNLDLLSGHSTTLSLIISQGSTAGIANKIQIDGITHTIKWQGGTVPTGTNSGMDTIIFTVLRNSNSYTILGEKNSYA